MYQIIAYCMSPMHIFPFAVHRIMLEKERRMAKPSPKLDRLQGDLLPVVNRLREDGLSWAKVSAYLAKYHKLKVSRGYLQDTFT